MNLNEYFNNLNITELRAQYPDFNGSILIEMYKNIVRYVEEDNVTRIIATPDRYLVYRGDEIIHEIPSSNFKTKLLNYREELREDIIKGTYYGIKTFLTALPIIIERDKIISSRFKIIRNQENYFEAEIVLLAK
jgi:hypothetical protein